MEVEITVDPKYHKHFIQRRGQVGWLPLCKLLWLSDNQHSASHSVDDTKTLSTTHVCVLVEGCYLRGGYVCWWRVIWEGATSAGGGLLFGRGLTPFWLNGIRMEAWVRACNSNRSPWFGQNYWTLLKIEHMVTCSATRRVTILMLAVNSDQFQILRNYMLLPVLIRSWWHL